jgi:hypothetical protein
MRATSPLITSRLLPVGRALGLLGQQVGEALDGREGVLDLVGHLRAHRLHRRGAAPRRRRGAPPRRRERVARVGVGVREARHAHPEQRQRRERRDQGHRPAVGAASGGKGTPEGTSQSPASTATSAQSRRPPGGAPTEGREAHHRRREEHREHRARDAAGPEGAHRDARQRGEERPEEAPLGDQRAAPAPRLPPEEGEHQGEAPEHRRHLAPRRVARRQQRRLHQPARARPPTAAAAGRPSPPRGAARAGAAPKNPRAPSRESIASRGPRGRRSLRGSRPVQQSVRQRTEGRTARWASTVAWRTGGATPVPLRRRVLAA